MFFEGILVVNDSVKPPNKNRINRIQVTSPFQQYTMKYYIYNIHRTYMSSRSKNPKRLEILSIPRNLKNLRMIRSWKIWKKSGEVSHHWSGELLITVILHDLIRFRRAFRGTTSILLVSFKTWRKKKAGKRSERYRHVDKHKITHNVHSSSN